MQAGEYPQKKGPKKESKVADLLKYFVIGFLLVAGLRGGFMALQGVSEPEPPPSPQEMLVAEVQAAQAELPIAVDETMEAFAIEAGNLTIQYSYRIFEISSEDGKFITDDPAMVKELGQQTRDEILKSGELCSELKDFFEAGISAEMDWFSNDRRLKLYGTRIEPKDCGM